MGKTGSGKTTLIDIISGLSIPTQGNIFIDNKSINESLKSWHEKISYIDQFPEPQNMEQGNFLQKLSDSLEESKNKLTVKLPTGSTIVANNYFWLHGRKAFKENKDLNRELLRIRGIFQS